MEKEPMTKLIDALFARTHFGEIMGKAEQQNTRFLVSRRGKPKVVILSVEDYVKNIVRKSDILAEIQLSAAGSGLDQIGEEEINAEITAWRKTKK
jgi:prevent-host-death family protein